jgi:hypothetical protein
MQEKVCITPLCSVCGDRPAEPLEFPRENPKTRIHSSTTQPLSLSFSTQLYPRIFPRAGGGASLNIQFKGHAVVSSPGPPSHADISLCAEHVESGLKWKVLHDQSDMNGNGAR